MGRLGAIIFFHKFFAVVLTLAFAIHLKDIFTRAFVRRKKGIFWGPTSMVANWKDAKDLIGHLRWFVGPGPSRSSSATPIGRSSTIGRSSGG